MIQSVNAFANMPDVAPTIKNAEGINVIKHLYLRISITGIGSDIKFRTEWEGKVYEQWGKVLEMRPKELVKYNLYAPRPGLEDRPENYFIMTYVLTHQDGQTQLKIIQEDNRPNAAQEEPQGEENPVLKSLKELAEAD